MKCPAALTAFLHSDVYPVRILLLPSASPSSSGLSALTQGVTHIFLFLLERSTQLPGLIMHSLADSDLYTAAQEGDVERVKKLVEAGMPINEKTLNGRTPLQSACFYGHLPVVEYLVEHGGNMNERDTYGLTPMHYACYKRHLNVVVYLIEHGGNVNERTEDGWTPLLLAAQEGHLSIVECLVEHGAIVNAKYVQGRTHFASCNSNIHQFLEPYTDICIASSTGNIRALDYIIKRGESNINTKDKYGKTGMHYAAMKGHLYAVNLLICNGGDAQMKDKRGRTALHYACEEGHLEVVKCLVVYCGVNERDEGGNTPLHHAAIKGKIEVVEYLVRHGGTVNERDEEGTTLLHYAAQEGHLEVVRYLVEERRMNVNERDNYGNTPADYASMREWMDVVNYLVEHGGSVEKSASFSNDPISSLSPSILQFSDRYAFKREKNMMINNNSGATETCLIGPVLRNVSLFHLFSFIIFSLFSLFSSYSLLFDILLLHFREYTECFIFSSLSLH